MLTRASLSLFLLGSAAGLPACAGPRAVGIARVQVELDEVVFGEVRHAAIHEIVVPVVNSGTRDARATLIVTAPFLIENNAITLGADERAEVSVFFLPSSYDAAAGSLTVRGGGRDVVVSVTASVATDFDQDGFIAEGAGGDDCDDTRADVRPGLPEQCDGIDNDCDGGIDQDAVDASAFFADADADGFGDPATEVLACTQPRGFVANDEDCDDSSRFFAPGATERSDGLDQDCDGRVDEHLMDPGALVVTEIHPGIEPDLLPYVEFRLGDPPAPIYLQGLEVEIDDERVTLAGDGIGYASSAAPVLLLCGLDAPGVVSGVACVGRLPGAVSGASRIALISEGLVDAVTTDGIGITAEASAELEPGANADDNDAADAWCTSTAPLGAGSGSPGSLSDHCEAAPDE